MGRESERSEGTANAANEGRMGIRNGRLGGHIEADAVPTPGSGVLQEREPGLQTGLVQIEEIDNDSIIVQRFLCALDLEGILVKEVELRTIPCILGGRDLSPTTEPVAEQLHDLGVPFVHVNLLDTIMAQDFTGCGTLPPTEDAD